jgi:hypothetical protein
MRNKKERVQFRLIQVPCCGQLLCWVNPRLPNYCPECGEAIFTRLRFTEAERILISDQDAWLNYSD